MNECDLAIERVSPSEDHLGGYALFWEDPREHRGTYLVKKGSKGFIVAYPGILDRREKEYCMQEDAEIAAFREALCDGMGLVELNTTSSKSCRFLDRTGGVPDDYRLGGRTPATL